MIRILRHKIVETRILTAGRVAMIFTAGLVAMMAEMGAILPRVDLTLKPEEGFLPSVFQLVELTH